MAPNTAWRQLQALIYLDSYGIDLGAIAGKRVPALIAIESVCRIGKIDRDQESRLLSMLLDGKRTVDFYLEAAKTTRQRGVPVTLDLRDQKKLSTILVENRSRRSSAWLNSDRFQIAFPKRQDNFLDRVPLPLVVTQETFGKKLLTTAFIYADRLGSTAQDRDFDLLFETSFLRALVTYGEVVFCQNLQLDGHSRGLICLDQAHGERTRTFVCDIEIDLGDPREDASFTNLDEYVAAFRAER